MKKETYTGGHRGALCSVDSCSDREVGAYLVVHQSVEGLVLAEYLNDTLLIPVGVVIEYALAVKTSGLVVVFNY